MDIEKGPLDLQFNTEQSTTTLKLQLSVTNKDYDIINNNSNKLLRKKKFEPEKKNIKKKGKFFRGTGWTSYSLL